MAMRGLEDWRCSMFDPRKHNYYRKVMELVERGEVQLCPGQVREVDIYHDDWCGIYRGDYCDCDPEIEVRPAMEPK